MKISKKLFDKITTRLSKALPEISKIRRLSPAILRDHLRSSSEDAKDFVLRDTDTSPYMD